jgi:monovalent cation:H+ antiporter-2, CPA2 family
MVLTRFLVERKELKTQHGHIMVAITLVEDLAVVVLVVLLPVLGTSGAGSLWKVAAALGWAVLILGPVLFIAAKVVPKILQRVSRTKNQELFFLVVLAICLGTAALTHAAGLSVALGAFIGGLIISNSKYAHRALSQLLPLRDAFVALFFVTIGLLIDPRALFSNIGLLASLVAMIVVGKFLIWAAVVKLFRHSWSTALLVAAGLTQIGEFSFVLVRVALDAGVVSHEVYNATLAAALFAILLNAGLVNYMPRFLSRMEENSRSRARLRNSLADGGANPLDSSSTPALPGSKG